MALMDILQNILTKLEKSERLLTTKGKKKRKTKAEKVLIARQNLMKAYVEYLNERLKKIQVCQRNKNKMEVEKRVEYLQEVIDFLKTKRRVERKKKFPAKRLRAMNKFLNEMVNDTKKMLNDIINFNKIQSKMEKHIYGLFLATDALRIIVEKNRTDMPKLKEIIEALTHALKKVEKHIKSTNG
ncbi:MAG: hypothetical protein DRP74_09415 [Candidatus Omnitrophota bacterium]|nr:MAG: hypothetical protein DRP74_09415 [Candidatus Omnitrophota bacterium]